MRLDDGTTQEKKRRIAFDSVVRPFLIVKDSYHVIADMAKESAALQSRVTDHHLYAHSIKLSHMFGTISYCTFTNGTERPGSLRCVFAYSNTLSEGVLGSCPSTGSASDVAGVALFVSGWMSWLALLLGTLTA
eukprot:m.147958 g.147958  ORF g.147958 m.147958 type:complete len:133 (+) comp16274_c0_seq13:287-685(+)